MAGLAGWLLLAGLAPAPAGPKLGYAAIDLDSYGPATLAGSAGESSALLPQSRPLSARPRSADIARWHLSVEAGMTADSNVGNASDDRFLAIRSGDAFVPVELDSSLRPKRGIGRGLSVSSGVRLRLSDGAAFVVDAEGQALDHRGGRNDDISYLLAAGPELTWSGGKAAVQLVASDQRYGGVSANAGVGLRASYRTDLGAGGRISLYLDARRFESDYGRDFGGTQAGAYVAYSRPLDPDSTGSLGLYARRDWLVGDPYAHTEVGGQMGVSRYLGPALLGSLSAGIGRTRYDAPLLSLSDARRADWRGHVGVTLSARNPVGPGLVPSIGYTYSRTDSTIGFFDAERHRVRLGVRRSF